MGLRTIVYQRPIRASASHMTNQYRGRTIFAFIITPAFGLALTISEKLTMCDCPIVRNDKKLWGKAERSRGTHLVTHTHTHAQTHRDGTMSLAPFVVFIEMTIFWIDLCNDQKIAVNSEGR